MKDPEYRFGGTSLRLEGNADFLTYLVEQSAIDHMTLERVRSVQYATGQSIDTVMLELGLLEESALAGALSNYLQIDRVSAADFEDGLDERFTEQLVFLRQQKLWVIELKNDRLVLATPNPLNDTAARALSYLFRAKLVLKVCTRSEMERHLQQLVLVTDVPNGLVLTGDAETADIEKLHDIASEAPIVRLLGRLIAVAIERNSSDIHIERSEDRVRIRYRIDGILQVAESIPNALHLGLVSRIKILARLNIAEQRLPQDGRLSIAVKGRNVDFRVATSPTSNGENVVMRILDKQAALLDLATLGYSADATSALTRILSAPNGIVLVTGPTGSGKTTTLYAALADLNSVESKIFTVEDPIEYNLKGINQIQVKPEIELSFAHILRSILRQDPDIIMVGEIRDAETAQIAVQAALTGHLVLSTLHTNSAAASITRLRNLGIDDHLIASSVRAIVAQRLLRKLCPRANQSKHDTGCAVCGGTGYSGRTVLYEILELSDNIKGLILSKRSEEEIEKAARNQGMSTLAEIGESRIHSGVTSRAEVLRVLGLAAL